MKTLVPLPFDGRVVVYFFFIPPSLVYCMYKYILFPPEINAIKLSVAWEIVEILTGIK